MVRLIIRDPLPTGIRIKAPSGEVEIPQNTLIQNGVYKIKARHSNLVFDAAYCTHSPGTNVWQCTDFDNNCQRWIIQSTEDGYYTISCVSGGALFRSCRWFYRRWSKCSTVVS